MKFHIISILIIYIQVNLCEVPNGNRVHNMEGLVLRALPAPGLTATSKTSLADKFFGLVYSPYRNNKYCPAKEDIVQDIKLLAPLTKHFHLYGMDCDQADMVLDAISSIAPDAKVMLGMWVRGPGRFELELEKIMTILKNQNYRNKVLGVCVGNEEIYSGQSNDADLATKIIRVRTQVRELGLSIPIFTAELPKLWTPTLVDASDAILANIHPYFDNARASTHLAAKRVIDQYRKLASTYATSHKPVVIGETGWPFDNSQPTATETAAGIAASNTQRTYLHALLCLCHRQGIPYYLFEAMDSPWKPINAFGDAERHFGLISAHRHLRYQPQHLLTC